MEYKIYLDFRDVFLVEDVFFELFAILKDTVLLLADLRAAALMRVDLFKEDFFVANLLDADFTALMAESWLMAAAQS